MSVSKNHFRHYQNYLPWFTSEVIKYFKMKKIAQRNLKKCSLDFYYENFNNIVSKSILFVKPQSVIVWYRTAYNIMFQKFLEMAMYKIKREWYAFHVLRHDLELRCLVVNRIPNFLLKNCASVFVAQLWCVYDRILQAFTFPVIWRKGRDLSYF